MPEHPDPVQNAEASEFWSYKDIVIYLDEIISNDNRIVSHTVAYISGHTSPWIVTVVYEPLSGEEISRRRDLHRRKLEAIRNKEK